MVVDVFWFVLATSIIIIKMSIYVCLTVAVCKHQYRFTKKKNWDIAHMKIKQTKMRLYLLLTAIWRHEWRVHDFILYEAQSSICQLWSSLVWPMLQFNVYCPYDVATVYCGISKVFSFILSTRTKRDMDSSKWKPVVKKYILIALNKHFISPHNF